MFWDDAKRRYPIRESILKEKNREDMINTQRYEYHGTKYNLIGDDGGNDFVMKAKELVAMDASFQIDGRAGCGKTTMLKHVMKRLDIEGKKYISCAPTNKACRILSKDAQTIHKLFSKFTAKTYRILDNYDYIIVDEKSMQRSCFSDCCSM